MWCQHATGIYPGEIDSKLYRWLDIGIEIAVSIWCTDKACGYHIICRVFAFKNYLSFFVFRALYGSARLNGQRAGWCDTQFDVGTIYGSARTVPHLFQNNI